MSVLQAFKTILETDLCVELVRKYRYRRRSIDRCITRLKAYFSKLVRLKWLGASNSHNNVGDSA